MCLDCDKKEREEFHKIIKSLHEACYHSVVEKVKEFLLVESVNKQDEDGNTPLHKSSSFFYMSFDIIKLLLDAGADIEIENNDGKTALQLADRDINKGAFSGGAFDLLLLHSIQFYVKNKSFVETYGDWILHECVWNPDSFMERRKRYKMGIIPGTIFNFPGGYSSCPDTDERRKDRIVGKLDSRYVEKLK